MFPRTQRLPVFSPRVIIGIPLSVACGTTHCILVTSEGVFGTGDNTSGQLGKGLPPSVIGFEPIVLRGMEVSDVVRVHKEAVAPPLKKPRRARRDPLKACRVCEASPTLMHQEIVHTDRLFCSPLCQRKYHYFAQVLGAVHHGQ